MSQSTTIQFRTTKDDKTGAEEILKTLGLDLPTILRACLKKIKAERGVPFDLHLKPELDENGLTPQQVKSILKAEKEAEMGINVSPTFNTAEEAIHYLRSQTDEN